MNKLIILGASGHIAKHVIDILVKKDGIHLTLFLRNIKRLSNRDVSNARIIEGDVLNFNQLKEAIRGQDMVYAYLSFIDLEELKNPLEPITETNPS